ALASTLQRLPVSMRAELAAPLLAHSEDANDHNLPLLIWYGLIPVADADPNALAKLAANAALPLTRKFISRRLAEDTNKNPAPLNALIEQVVATSAIQADVLNGMAEGLTGWRKATKPAAWGALANNLASSANTAVHDQLRNLSALFGDGRALDEVKKIALD